MDRRGFLRSIGLGIGGIALEQAIPLGRVWSFPKKIVAPELTSAACIALQLEKVRAQIPSLYDNDLVLAHAFAGGQVIAAYSPTLAIDPVTRVAQLSPA